MTLEATIDQLQAIHPVEWETLFGPSPPTSQPFMAAMDSNFAAQSGWQPQHLIVRSACDKLQAALPLYLKQHSYGEYVFDWSWASASERAGIPYYPKLITAVPFTPTVGCRLGLGNASDAAVRSLLERLIEQARQQHASSWHLLFSDQLSRNQIESSWRQLPGQQPLLERHDCQFHWFNRDYRDFDQFLQCFSSRKRKNIRKERRRIDDQGIRLQRLSGDGLTPDKLQLFFHFYQLTYHQRGQNPYLRQEFFDLIRRTMGQQLMLVLATRGQQPVGAALFLHDQQTLYGRWWGGLPEIDCLHFEACYYQGIEFAIERGLQRFDPGTQGEHKLTRGFEPVRTRSLHWIRHPGLRQAVADSLELERQQIDRYIDQCRQHLPFKRG